LIEEYLPGREFTVAIAGTGVRAWAVGSIEIAVQANSDSGIYSYHNKEEWERHVHYERVAPGVLRTAVETLALRAWRCLGCRDAGRVDVRLDATGQPCFLEVNPLAGLHPWHSDLPIICAKEGIAYQTLIGWIVESAATRVRSPRIADSKAA
jgi:D-alanine-D-alanine ligase